MNYFVLIDISGIYNIASGKRVTIKELAESMVSVSGKEIDIKYLAPKKGDIRCSQVISLLQKRS